MMVPSNVIAVIVPPVIKRGCRTKAPISDIKAT